MAGSSRHHPQRARGGKGGGVGTKGRREGEKKESPFPFQCLQPMLATDDGTCRDAAISKLDKESKAKKREGDMWLLDWFKPSNRKKEGKEGRMEGRSMYMVEEKKGRHNDK